MNETIDNDKALTFEEQRIESLNKATATNEFHLFTVIYDSIHIKTTTKNIF